MTVTAAPPVRPVRAIPRWVVVSAWTVPFLVVGQFAMVAMLPVVLVLVGSLRDSRLRALRTWAVALTAAYATPLVLWIVGPDRAPSLSKDMHPVLAGVIVAVSLTVIVVLHLIGRRSRSDANGARATESA